MGQVEMIWTQVDSTTLEIKMKKSSTSPAAAKQAGKPRMGRPPSKETYAIYLIETRNLMVAIKAGAGKLSNREIEEGLGIGRDETGAYSGRYFARYLNSPNSKNKVALTPDRLSQIAAKAQELGWLPKDKKSGIVIRSQFKHLQVADGELLSERIDRVKNERAMLKKAQVEVIDALNKLTATMKSCKSASFVYQMVDTEDGEECGMLFDGFSLNLESVIEQISSSIVFDEEFIVDGPLFS